MLVVIGTVFSCFCMGCIYWGGVGGMAVEMWLILGLFSYYIIFVFSFFIIIWGRMNVNYIFLFNTDISLCKMIHIIKIQKISKMQSIAKFYIRM